MQNLPLFYLFRSFKKIGGMFAFLISFDILLFFAMIGHLILSYALKLNSVDYIHPTICLIYILPILSSAALFGHYLLFN